MKIFYIITEDPALQGDYQEVSMLIGLRAILGAGAIDLPHKKVMYGDFSLSPKESLHGRGFTLFNKPIDLIRIQAGEELEITKDDVLLYGVVPETYGVKRRLDLEEKAGLVAVLDGHDDPNLRTEFVKHVLYFKRELYTTPKANVFSTGFGLPSHMIRPLNLKRKNQLFQQTYPKACFDPNYRETGRAHYIFDNETDYYDDMSNSWFGLTCKKGGWDSLRHHEIVAAGSLVLFRDFDQKPQHCAPQSDKFLGLNFSSKEEALEIMNRLVVNNKPTDEYLYCLNAQRELLWRHFTCEARAFELYRNILQYKYETSR